MAPLNRDALFSDKSAVHAPSPSLHSTHSTTVNLPNCSNPDVSPQTELEEVMICGEGIATFFEGGLLDAVAAGEPQEEKEKRRGYRSD